MLRQDNHCERSVLMRTGFCLPLRHGTGIVAAWLTVVTPLTPGRYAAAEAAEVAPGPEGRDHPVLRLKAGLPQPSAGDFDWERTVIDGRLRTADELREYLSRSDVRFPGTYRVEGSDAEAAFLVYLLRLLGHSGAHYDPVGKILTTP